MACKICFSPTLNSLPITGQFLAEAADSFDLASFRGSKIFNAQGVLSLSDTFNLFKTIGVENGLKVILDQCTSVSVESGQTNSFYLAGFLDEKIIPFVLRTYSQEKSDFVKENLLGLLSLLMDEEQLTTFLCQEIKTESHLFVVNRLIKLAKERIVFLPNLEKIIGAFLEKDNSNPNAAQIEKIGGILELLNKQHYLISTQTRNQLCDFLAFNTLLINEKEIVAAFQWQDLLREPTPERVQSFLEKAAHYNFYLRSAGMPMNVFDQLTTLLENNLVKLEQLPDVNLLTLILFPKQLPSGWFPHEKKKWLKTFTEQLQQDPVRKEKILTVLFSHLQGKEFLSWHGTYFLDFLDSLAEPQEIDRRIKAVFDFYQKNPHKAFRENKLLLDLIQLRVLEQLGEQQKAADLRTQIVAAEDVVKRAYYGGSPFAKTRPLCSYLRDSAFLYAGFRKKYLHKKTFSPYETIKVLDLASLQKDKQLYQKILTEPNFVELDGGTNLISIFPDIVADEDLAEKFLHQIQTEVANLPGKITPDSNLVIGKLLKNQDKPDLDLHRQKPIRPFGVTEPIRQKYLTFFWELLEKKKVEPEYFPQIFEMITLFGQQADLEKLRSYCANPKTQKNALLARTKIRGFLKTEKLLENQKEKRTFYEL